MKDFTSYKKEITIFLNTFLKQKQQDLKNSHFSQDIFERLLPLTTSGKMLRGSLLINTYEKLSGSKYSEEVLRAAAALELAQTGFLIHDDIIDQDELRRGQETIHRQYAKRAKRNKFHQPEHVGESLAICVADVVFFLVYELLPANLVKLFSQQLSLTALGEMNDVELSLIDGKEVTKDEILQMYLDKTASYSTSLPLMAGAVVANQSDEIIMQLDELGQNLGLIFQITDDELGIFGDESKTGKPVGVDIREGKKTLHYYYLIQEVDISNKNVGEVMKLMEKYQIRKKVDKELNHLKAKAEKQINDTSLTKAMNEMLDQFLDSVANRVR